MTKDMADMFAYLTKADDQNSFVNEYKHSFYDVKCVRSIEGPTVT